eukprot:4640510-Pyramimonas_sp.AAC.1
MATATVLIDLKIEDRAESDTAANVAIGQHYMIAGRVFCYMADMDCWLPVVTPIAFNPVTMSWTVEVATLKRSIVT